MYQRFKGIITNFSISEDTDILQGQNTNSISVTCASINTILENKVSGQRTTLVDRQRYFSGDLTFNRVADLHNVNYDFGREYVPGTQYGGGYPGPGGPMIPFPINLP